MKYHRNRYQAFLARLPAPGGNGAHIAIFAAGCHGARAGLTQAVVCEDIRKHLPSGTRHVSDEEIADGVRAGFDEVAGGGEAFRRPPPRIHPGTLQRLIREGSGTSEADIRARSPIPLDWPDHESGWRTLEALYAPDELLFIGEERQVGRLGETIRPVRDWVALLKQIGSVPFSRIAVNPVTGKPAVKRSGDGVTLRGDGCVAVHRFAVAEMDGLPIQDQLAFWRALPHLPVAALIHSGGKSVHAWLRVNCANASTWKQAIEDTLFPSYLEPLGVDGACKNEGRMSRMPGHVRAETSQMQRLLYLAPAGKALQ